jgi:hypothetical protein
MSALAKMMSGIVSIVDAFSTQFLLVSDPSPTLSEIGEGAVRRVGLSVLKQFLHWYKFCEIV